MTDITELAQSLKAAAEKATPGQWMRSSVQFNSITDIANPMEQGNKPHIANTSEKRDAEFIALANPANILALVEALEKAQQRIAELENYAEAEAVGADRAAEDGVYWMKRCKDAQSKLEATENHNLSLLETLEKTQETIAFQQGEIKALLSSLESRTVKLPDALLPATHKSGELFMTPDNVEQGGYLNRDDVLRVLRDAGIKVEAE